jgi:hypothetical protein
MATIPQVRNDVRMMYHAPAHIYMCLRFYCSCSIHLTYICSFVFYHMFTLSSTAHVLVCNADTANTSLAAHFLSVFIAVMAEHFGNLNVFEDPTQLFQHPEHVFILLDKFLPNGQIGYVLKVVVLCLHCCCVCLAKVFRNPPASTNIVQYTLSHFFFFFFLFHLNACRLIRSDLAKKMLDEAHAMLQMKVAKKAKVAMT